MQQFSYLRMAFRKTRQLLSLRPNPGPKVLTFTDIGFRINISPKLQNQISPSKDQS